MNPLYSQPVTVYRKEKDSVTRMVIRDTLFYHTDYNSRDNLGEHRHRDFLLIVPGGRFVPKIGDRVMEGLGPQEVDWDTFYPGSVHGLGEVGYVATTYLAGKIHHYEAGAGSTR